MRYLGGDALPATNVLSFLCLTVVCDPNRMARWDDILTLPVQQPPVMEFSSLDLIWSKVEGWRQGVDDVALIPFSRVEDFVRGECSNAECPTKFRVEARRKKTEGSSCKPRVDGYLEYILYWCCYGPDDHRKGGTSRPSRRYRTGKKKSVGRPHTKRGCMCHFIVKRLFAQPSVALIIYNQRKHVDKSGSPCHGPLDSNAVGTRAMYAPYISEELRQRVMSMLYAGVSVESIMQKHMDAVERHGGPSNRDDLLSHKYVRKLERDIRRSTYELDSDDALSIQMWVENHQNYVFFYQESSDTDPFILGIQTEWQLQQMVQFGNNSLIAAGLGFGTNKFKYPVYTLLVFDSNRNGLPIAWVITPSFGGHDACKWMGALYDRVCAKDSTWKLNGFIIDDAETEFATIREVFQCSILLSLWRVRHAWHRNLIKKCSNIEMQREMFKRLGHIMYNTWSQINVMEAMDEFIEDFVDHSAFLDYFKARWLPKIEMWVTAMRTFPLASQQTSAALESYYTGLKSKLLNESDTAVFQRADWLVHKLSTEVHSHYWFYQYAEENDLCGYTRDDDLASTSWHRALYIADSDVILNDKDPQFAKVVSQSDRAQTYVVWNPGSEFAICECSWSMSGNLCKHVIKVSVVCRNRQVARPSMALQTYHQTLFGLLQSPPNDSIVLDHAITLAIRVQQDLKKLVEPSNRSSMNSILNMVPVDWIGKKCRVSRHRASSINENNNSIHENIVSATVDKEAIIDKNVLDDKATNDEPITYENVSAEKRMNDGISHKNVLDEKAIIGENNGHICSNGISINADDGDIHSENALDREGDESAK